VGTSLERIRAVGDATSEALALSDPEGIVLVVNPAYCALYGRPADAFVGHSFTRIFPETDQAMALDQYRAVFAAPDPPQSYAARIQRPDGSERSGCVDCTPSCDGMTCGGDGCGGVCPCGEGQLCSGGACVTPPCTPTCDGKTCGDDGCGGSCGTCKKHRPTCDNAG
jgi:PAS domain S-box-containing protein